jgi:hypothetical protein
MKASLRGSPITWARLLGIAMGAVLRVLSTTANRMVQPESSAAVTLTVIDPWAELSVRLDPILNRSR